MTRGERKAIATFMQAVDRAIMGDLPAAIVSGYVAGACQAIAIAANVGRPLAEEMNRQALDIDAYVFRLANGAPQSRSDALHDLADTLRQ